ncbi:MAG: YggS family pyridoxal phosphate-dependent enzyme [Gammaproteobacteria bacterium]|nr:YggS family pyridoxal phosphate-dependent enzyme [Gammaproteobacteria bacterium]
MTEGTSATHRVQPAADTECAGLRAVWERLACALAEAGRASDGAHLVAVSKTVPSARLREMFACGQRTFGESYVQEALAKQEALADLPIEWHFIGPLQSNKTRPVAERFAWVHSVDRLRIAERLSAQRPADLPPLNVCLQVNIDREATKSGIAPDPEEVSDLAHAVAQLPRLALRGLMAIPAPTDDPLRQRDSFRRVRALFEQLQSEGLALDTLSMGMSDDLEAAVLEGATLVRVGRAIFGARPGPGH